MFNLVPGGSMATPPRAHGAFRALPYLLPAGYLVFLWVRGLPLYDPRPVANLALRFLFMDLLPILWVLPFFWRQFRGWREFGGRLVENTQRAPAPLAAPALAVLLFILESGGAVLEPFSAGPTPLSAVLWMQAAAAFMAATVLHYGTGNIVGKRAGVSTLVFILLFGGGAGYFLWTHCDISRLLIGIGLAGWGTHKTIWNSGMGN